MARVCWPSMDDVDGGFDWINALCNDQLIEGMMRCLGYVAI